MFAHHVLAVEAMNGLGVILAHRLPMFEILDGEGVTVADSLARKMDGFTPFGRLDPFTPQGQFDLKAEFVDPLQRLNVCLVFFQPALKLGRALTQRGVFVEDGGGRSLEVLRGRVLGPPAPFLIHPLGKIPCGAQGG